MMKLHELIFSTRSAAASARDATGALLLASIGCIAAGSPSLAQTAGLQERVAAIKRSLIESQAALRNYEWVETVVVSHKGEEKSRKQSRCYYGADGKLQKVELSSDSGGGRKPRGLRGRVVEKKTEDVTEYMEMAAALIQEYVPPDPAKIQAVVDAGRLSVTPLAGGSGVRLDLDGYHKAGDVLSFEIDSSTNQILSAKVSTFFDDSGDPVGLDVRFGTLADGSIYTEETTLDAPGKDITVEVTDGGYKPAG